MLKIRIKTRQIIGSRFVYCPKHVDFIDDTIYTVLGIVDDKVFVSYEDEDKIKETAIELRLFNICIKDGSYKII